MAACDDWGKPEDEAKCPGCVPVPAADDSMLCARCSRSLTRHLEDAADLIGHLRSIADPMKAAVYDRVMVSASKPDVPAPVAADLLDASDDMMRTLREWALHVQFGPGHPWRAQGLEAGIDAADAYDDAAGCARVILAALERGLQGTPAVKPLADAVLTRNDGPGHWWSIADALARWPLDDRPRWATMPCPGCDCKTVRVTPPRRVGMSARYTCTTCEWDRTDNDDGGFWAEAFAEVVPAAA
ncbi:hypothetical protein [Microbacterium arborescens]